MCMYLGFGISIRVWSAAYTPSVPLSAANAGAQPKTPNTYHSEFFLFPSECMRHQLQWMSHREQETRHPKTSNP